MSRSVIVLTKSRQAVLRSILITAIIILVLLFFVVSDLRATGEITRFGWLVVAATVAGLLAIAQQVFHYRKEPGSLQLHLHEGQLINGDDDKVMAKFDKVTFFALSTNKNSALIECHRADKLVMRIKRHYELPMKIADILAANSELDTVEVKFIGLTQ